VTDAFWHGAIRQDHRRSPIVESSCMSFLAAGCPG
jgi:hypothetical protein